MPDPTPPVQTPDAAPDVQAPTPARAGITPGPAPQVSGPSSVPALAPQPNPAMKAAKHVADFIKGYSTSYEPQPDGTVKEVQTPQSTGQFFRGLVVSGILGAGAGANSPDLASGAAAGVKAQ